MHIGISFMEEKIKYPKYIYKKKEGKNFRCYLSAHEVDKLKYVQTAIANVKHT